METNIASTSNNYSIVSYDIWEVYMRSDIYYRRSTLYRLYISWASYDVSHYGKLLQYLFFIFWFEVSK